MKPVSSMTKDALIKNARDLRGGGHASPVLHPAITMAELTFRYRGLISELKRKFNGTAQQPDLRG